VLSAWGAAAAQERPDANPDRRLDYFVGSWDVRVAFKLPDGTEGDGSATCETASIMDGAFLQQEYQGTFKGRRLVIRQLLGYDDQRRRYVQSQLHEGGGATHTDTSPRGLVLGGRDGSVARGGLV